MERCFNKTECDIRLKELIKPDKFDDVTPDSTVFIQHTCEETPEIVMNKKNKLWVLSSLQILTIMVFVFTVYVFKEQVKDYKDEFELKKTSIGNYTAKIVMNEAIIKEFKNYREENKQELGEIKRPAQDFKNYLKS